MLVWLPPWGRPLTVPRSSTCCLEGGFPVDDLDEFPRSPAVDACGSPDLAAWKDVLSASALRKTASLRRLRLT